MDTHRTAFLRRTTTYRILFSQKTTTHWIEKQPTPTIPTKMQCSAFKDPLFFSSGTALIGKLNSWKLTFRKLQKCPGGFTCMDLKQSVYQIINRNCSSDGLKVMNLTSLVKNYLNAKVDIEGRSNHREQARGRLGRKSLPTDSNFSLFSAEGEV